MDYDKSDTISMNFNRNNYALWKFHFHTFVEGKDLTEILDGSIPKPKMIKKELSRKQKMLELSLEFWILLR